MSSAHVIVDFLITAILAAILGAAAMGAVMWLMTRAQWAHSNMVIAVGSLFTRIREDAAKVGFIVHCVSAVGWAIIYTLAMIHLHLTGFPRAFFTGIGFGVLHGIVVSLMLVWVVSDQHPLEEFRGADFAIGLCHLVGHVVYGAGVGFVIGLASVAGWI